MKKHTLGDRGYGLIHILVFSSLIGLMSVTILNLIMNFKKNSLLEISILKNSINADHCLSGITSLTANSTNIKGLDTTHWYDSTQNLNHLTFQLLAKSSVLNRISNDSPILETVNVALPILRRENLIDKNSYSSPLKITDFNGNGRTDHLLMITPWNSLIVKTKMELEAQMITGTKLTFSEKPTSILTFGDKNILDALEPSTATKPDWLAVVRSYGIIYRTDKNILEYRSLLTSDTQPMCEKLRSFSRNNSVCRMEIGDSPSQSEVRKFSCKNRFNSSLTKLNLLDIW